MLDVFLATRGNVNEPKVVVLYPKEDCFGWMVVDCGGLSKVPIKELFKGITGDSFQYLVPKSFEVPRGSDSSKGKFFLEFLKDDGWVTPTTY